MSHSPDCPRYDYNPGAVCTCDQKRLSGLVQVHPQLHGGLLAAVDAVVKERHRQMADEGWSREHDDEHREGELATAAACYALFSTLSHRLQMLAVQLWPWATTWWKPKDRRRDLVRAGALILAEIERLDRLDAALVATGQDWG